MAFLTFKGLINRLHNVAGQLGISTFISLVSDFFGEQVYASSIRLSADAC